MELFTVMIGLIRQVFSVAMYSKKETGNLCCTYNDLIQLHFNLVPRSLQITFEQLS